MNSGWAIPYLSDVSLILKKPSLRENKRGRKGANRATTDLAGVAPTQARWTMGTASPTHSNRLGSKGWAIKVPGARSRNKFSAPPDQN
jgi:hypothetical protein